MVISDWATTAGDSWLNIWDRFVNFLPSLIGALIILIIGWIIGMILSMVIDRLFRIIGLQSLFEKAKVEDVLKKANAEQDATSLLASAVKWIVFLVAFIAAANVLQLTEVAGFLDKILAYIPSVIAAGAILLIGLILANFLSSVVKGSLSASGLGADDTVAIGVRYAIIVFAVLAALAQLGIAETMIQTLFIGVVALIAIAGGLAFGLGGQGVARDWLEHVRKQLK
ncbi:TPA: hypothetical protein DD449_05355 [Candidatus Berkelbacteria bacterium]|nr:hypothetical protein [Candidatus Berkelbacteria bacterium]